MGGFTAGLGSGLSLDSTAQRPPGPLVGVVLPVPHAPTAATSRIDWPVLLRLPVSTRWLESIGAASRYGESIGAASRYGKFVDSTS
jgi:hypothetical protein